MVRSKVGREGEGGRGGDWVRESAPARIQYCSFYASVWDAEGSYFNRAPSLRKPFPSPTFCPAKLVTCATNDPERNEPLITPGCHPTKVYTQYYRQETTFTPQIHKECPHDPQKGQCRLPRMRWCWHR